MSNNNITRTRQMPTALLAGTVQPPALTLLSTDGSPALPPLWQSHTGTSSRAAVQVLKDTAYPRAEGRSTAHVPKHVRGGNITDTVVHLQSPVVGDTYIEIGSSAPLGAELPWLGAQIKQLGQRPFALEAVIVDTRERKGRIRFESARKEPSLLANRSPPLLRLPLEMPSGERVTEWSEVVVNFARLVPLFRQLRSEDEEEEREAKRPRVGWSDLPDGRLGSVAAVRVYANCRVRRVWLSTEGGVKGEWELVGVKQ